MYGIRDYIEACQYRRDFLSNQRDWLVKERNQFGQDAERLAGTLERIRQEMIGYLIPEVHDTHLESLESRLSYPGLLPIKKQYDTRFDETEKRRAELAAMSEVEFHDVRLEQATTAVEEIRPAYESSRGDVSLWEDSKWFQKLNKRGYFQRGYAPGFFRW